MTASITPQFDIEVETGFSHQQWVDEFIQFGHDMYLEAKRDYWNGNRKSARRDMRVFKPLYLLFEKGERPANKKWLSEAFVDYLFFKHTNLYENQPDCSVAAWRVVAPIVMGFKDVEPESMSLDEAMSILAG